MKTQLHLALIAMSMIAFTSCQQTQQAATEQVETISEAQTWFDSQEWLEGAKMKPAVSIDIEEFAAHYKAHPNRWKKVFETLANNDLNTLPLGLTEIDENIKMNVQEYTTRPTVGKQTLFERHEEYIDVQCMIAGEELHGAQKFGNQKVAKEFSKEKDIALLECEDVPFYIIPAGTFTIFFPDDLHTTNYGFGEQTEVRKIVFKVKYN